MRLKWGPLEHLNTSSCFHTLAMLASQTYGTHYGKTRKAQALSEEVKALEAAGVAAQAEYERVRDRNLEVRSI